tara:strand:+ start:1455 stop:2591 length:1137 start_codon:yes stop_codon:yes gene_type:complete
MSLIPTIGQKYLLKQTIPVSARVWLSGNFRVENIENFSVKMRFENNKVLSVNVNDWSSLRIKETISEEDPTTTYTKTQLYNFVSNIIGTDVRDEPDIKRFLDKVDQDSFSTPGYGKYITYSKYEQIKSRLEADQSREQIQAEINNGNRIHCGAILNRSNRWNPNVLSKPEEEAYLRCEDNFGFLPYGIRAHDAASKYECNLILLKLISFLIKLRGIPERFNITTEQINQNYNNLLLQQRDNLNISEEDFNYLKNHNQIQNQPHTRDFLTNTQLALVDIQDQQYKNMEHKLNFCHVFPQLGTKYKNVCFGLTRPNRLQGDLTMKQLFILYLYGDTDERRLELINIILTNNPSIASILNSDEEITQKITNITTYLENQYY